MTSTDSMILNMFESCNVTHTAMLLMRIVKDEERCKRLNFKLDRTRGQLVFVNFHLSGAMETMVTNITLFLKFGLPESGAIADLLHFFLETIEDAPLCVLVRSDYALCIVMTLSSGMTWMLNGFNVLHLQSVNLPNFSGETLNEFETCILKRIVPMRSVKHLRQLEDGEGVWMEKECKKMFTEKIDNAEIEFVTDEESEQIDKEMGLEIVPLFWSIIRTENTNTHLANRVLKWRNGRIERSVTVKHGWLYEMWSELKDVARNTVEASILNSEFFADDIEDYNSTNNQKFDFVTLLDILTRRDTSFVSTVRQESMTIKSLRIALICLGALSLEKSTLFKKCNKALEWFETYFGAHWTRMQFFESVASRLSDSKRLHCACEGFHLIMSLLNADGLELFRTVETTSALRLLTPYNRFAHVYGFFMRFDCITGKVTPDGMNLLLRELEQHEHISSLLGFYVVDHKNERMNIENNIMEWKCADCKNVVVNWKMASTGDCLPCSSCSKLFCPQCIFNMKYNEKVSEEKGCEEIHLHCSNCNFEKNIEARMDKLRSS